MAGYEDRAFCMQSSCSDVKQYPFYNLEQYCHGERGKNNIRILISFFSQLTCYRPNVFCSVLKGIFFIRCEFPLLLFDIHSHGTKSEWLLIMHMLTFSYIVRKIKKIPLFSGGVLSLSKYGFLSITLLIGWRHKAHLSFKKIENFPQKAIIKAQSLQSWLSCIKGFFFFFFFLESTVNSNIS